MTPDALRRHLADLPGAWPSTADPVALLRALEDSADAEPAHRGLARAVRLAHGLAVADQGVPLLIAGVRRSRLIRWDEWTTTWLGSDVATGSRTMVRVVRPHLATDPVVRRALRRDARALGAIDPSLRWVEHPLPALRRPIVGATLSADTAEDNDGGRLVRLLLTGLASLDRWERAGVPTPGLAPEEWVVVDGNLTVACLTAGDAPGDPSTELVHLAHALRRWWGGGPTTPVDAVLDGFLTFPPESVQTAARLTRRALAEHLTGLRHSLERRNRVLAVKAHGGRLTQLLDRLAHSMPPPSGVGAVGVDLDGHVRIVRSDGHRVAWGTHGRDLRTVVEDGVLDPVESRRLLRARAAAPPNPRLSAQVDGSEEFTEAVCRWVSSAHHLRTLRLLIERSR